MSKKMLIDAAHPEEVRVAVLDHGKVEDFDFESAARKPLRGNIYLARVTRVEPSLQAAFVEYGGNRHGFLAFSEIHPDYYQIPVSDRQALQAAEAEVAELADLLDLGQPGDEDDEEIDARGIAGEEAESRRRPRNDARASAAMAQPPAAEDVLTEDAGQDESDDADHDDADHDGADHDGADHDGADAASVDSDDDRDGANHEFDDPVDEIDGVSDDEEEEEEEDGEEDGAGRRRGRSAEDEDGDDDAVEAGADDADEDGDADDIAAADVDGASARHDEDQGDEEHEEADEGDDESEADDDSAPARVRPSGKEREALYDRYKEARRRRAQLLRNYKIQEVVKRRQILLVQVVKEERGNKGAALTTYMSLAGRYCVLMPNTARGGGISRKIPQSTDRRRLRRVVDDLDVPKGMGLIIRTAGAKRTKTEIKRDYDYLLRLWENIRTLTLNSIAPCLIYEEASLIKRAIRDLYDKDISEVQVEGEAGYREAKDFMKMLMPSHAKFVQPYKDTAPVFLRHGVEQQLDGMYQPVVRLKSGGYIVIHQTEALVAIDVNSGRATRERNIEQTAVKTNIEAAYEAARQMRLRDLAGLIVLDFIDMEEQKNNRKVEKALKDAIKHDRARIQLGRISNFGLLEMSRQRRRSGIVDGTTQACPTCAGAGVIRSSEMAALRILRAAEGEAISGRAGVLTIHASLDVTVYVLNHHRDWLKRIEEQHGVTIQFIPDTSRAGDDFSMDKAGAPRERAAVPSVIRADQPETIDVETDDEVEDETPEAEASEERDGERRGRRRRRRRRKDGGREDGAREDQGRENSGDGRRPAPAQEAADAGDDADGEAAESAAAEGDAESGDDEQARRRRRRGRRGGRRNRRGREGGDEASAEGAESDATESGVSAVEDDSGAADDAQGSAAPDDDVFSADDNAEIEDKAPVANGHDHHHEAEEDAPAEPAVEDEPVAAAPVDAPAPDALKAAAESAKPRRSGWWRRNVDA